MLELFVSAFATLFVVIDPPGCAPIFASLTRGASDRHRRVMAVRSAVTAGVVLLAFALFGEPFLSSLGISLDAFRIAGGIMLFLIAIEMVFERRTERRENRAQEVAAEKRQKPEGLEGEDISVFPMAIPMIAGPGSIASVMLLVGRSEGPEETAVVLLALLLVLVLTLGSLLAAGTILRVVGRRVEATLTRLLGLVLAALAAQFVLDGVRQSFGIGGA